MCLLLSWNGFCIFVNTFKCGSTSTSSTIAGHQVTSIVFPPSTRTGDFCWYHSNSSLGWNKAEGARGIMIVEGMEWSCISKSPVLIPDSRCIVHVLGVLLWHANKVPSSSFMGVVRCSHSSIVHQLCSTWACGPAPPHIADSTSHWSWRTLWSSQPNRTNASICAISTRSSSSTWCARNTRWSRETITTISTS